MKSQNIPFLAKIIICILAAELLGSLGGIITSQSVNTWYRTLYQPAGNPPNWVFAPVWAMLYAMIGASFAFVWQQGFTTNTARIGATAFAIQMILNLAWTPIFFGLHQLFAALVVIVLLWLAILVTIMLFSKRSKVAARLLVPYLAWVSFATYLNAGYWWLNR